MRPAHTSTERYRSGRNGGASKASCRVTGTWVRIPPSPPSFQPIRPPRYLDTVFEAAKSKARTRTGSATFAVSLLEAGVSIENVSVLLGHSSVRITEQHYKPWVKTLQKKLED